MKKIVYLLILILIISPFILGQEFSKRVKSFTLSNGMRFFVLERHQVPTFAGMIMVKVGSVDEKKGETGIAHFFEHMAFKGTPVIGSKDWEKEKIILKEMDKIGNELAAEYAKGEEADSKKIEILRKKLAELQNKHRKYVVKDEIDKIYSENGGEFLNASTGNDTTQYFVMLPSNRLELWFLIESERFKYPALREFYSERDVVCEERRMYEDNNPDGFLQEEFYHVAFILHPYRHPVVGYLEDLLTLTKKKALNFYKTYYIPNNMVAAIVGDVNFEEVKKLAEEYFGDIPAGPEPPRPHFIEPHQKGERRVIVKFDAEPRLLIGYHIPSWFKRDNIVLELISYILSRGDSSRLRRDLVIDRKMALTVYTSINDPGVRYPSLFTIYCQPRHPHTPEELEKAVYEHLEKLKKEPVSKEEIEKAINQAEASLYRSFGFAENVFLAMRILRNVLLFNDLDADFKRVSEMKKITPQDIMNVARKYFTESNRTVGVLLRKEKAK
ncbi:insulinase family protein [Candidatus Aminicenantes bacterium AC-335-B20]|jgi:predicted Zn-dependent peptidase|nr:insulinase family protein [SCandidatus Aminicenantes bacterium Aminicenantia_JdfR_composite]MCP2596325.1 insulinase family protein [Candidatus Aminicenantes bacterium AC-335-G13]MCP2599161.1 insulinase family protein [Candidatus Aminicenantes bacterium AC-335-B20]MCP2617800.1 insulinase family protein [Candidatus Aminicenantes bacterium AC-335-A11]